MHKKSILILGAGFGGLTVLKYLLRNLKKRDDIQITLIDKQNYFLFSPLLHELAVGVLFPENIVVPIRNLYRSKIHRFVQASVEDINLADHEVKTSAGVFSYDYIVLALGGVTDISDMADNIENGSNVFSLKSAEDAVAIKNHMIKMFEKASSETDPAAVEKLLTFVISGAGYTGVQLASSLSDVVYKYLLSSYPDIDPARIKINLIESKDRVISELPEKYSRYVMKHLQKHNINVRLNCRITEIGSHR
ncbi:MAG: FAD-dependent oxidoreductase, partial [Dehalococcoidales bacterium]|nr:FAD-dependent oxidoreductase [Dehalococcoidales bacterium]